MDRPAPTTMESQRTTSSASASTLSPHPSQDPQQDLEKAPTEIPRNRNVTSLDNTTSHRFGDWEHDDELLDHTISRTSTTASDTTEGITHRETLVARLRSRQPRGPFSHPLAQQKTSVDALVDFDGKDDPYKAANWPTKKKILTTLLYGLLTMTSSWDSAAISAGTNGIAREFNVGSQVAVLGTSLFMIGFGIGPLLWAPLSEVLGRRMAVFPPAFVGLCFTFAAGSAANVQTLMICRFWGAFFSSAPVTNSGGVLADLFGPESRAFAMSGYAAAVVLGPTIAPIVSAAFVSNASLGWRWTLYFTGIIQAAALLANLLFIDETYPPALLVAKAKKLRLQTGNWALHAEFEQWDISIKQLSQKFLIRPFQILGTPIGFSVCLYASSCYGLLYMQLGAIPIIFEQIRGWGVVTGSLPFCGMTVGAFLGMGLNILNQFRYNRIMREKGAPVPEARLPPMMLGGILFAAGQFLAGWTAGRQYFWIAPVIGYTLFGSGFMMIFAGALNYLVDVFTKYSASAVGGNTALRSIFACGLPLAVTPMYRALGPGFSSTVTGSFAALLIPVPWFLYFKGESARARSKWSRDSVR